MIMQAAFFKRLTPIPLEDAVGYLKSYRGQLRQEGDKVVDMNNRAVALGVSALVKVNTR